MYGLLFVKPMSSLAGIYGQFQQALGASTRIIDVLQVSPEANDTGKKDLVFSKGDITFNQLSFNYSEDKPLFTQLNAHFKPQSVNIIVGENGSGKTSLLHLLMRFTEPKSGTIMLDGQDLAGCSLGSLRRLIGLVSQDLALSHGSVLENISYGQPDTSIEQVKQAAKAAGAHSFIEKLPQGYYTQVGDNGVLLSGGQRQRISLARTLLLDCKSIIFDEPTSFANSFGKQAFGELLKTELREHTLIVVTHDKGLSDIADQLFQLDQGQLKLIEDSKTVLGS
jgi:ATP-binding cassette subfamily B protein